MAGGIHQGNGSFGQGVFCVCEAVLDVDGAVHGVPCASCVGCGLSVWLSISTRRSHGSRHYARVGLVDSMSVFISFALVLSVCASVFCHCVCVCVCACVCERGLCIPIRCIVPAHQVYCPKSSSGLLSQIIKWIVLAHQVDCPTHQVDIPVYQVYCPCPSGVMSLPIRCSFLPIR